MSGAVKGAPACAGRNVAHELSLPFELIEGDEHHGPYIVNNYGADVCDFYAMSNPSSPSVRNGGDSKPVWFTDAAANAAFMLRAANCHEELLAALKSAEGILSRAGYAEWPGWSLTEIRAAIAKAEGRTNA
ncbi:hypothetical protein EET67_04930 [Pseudaminobacter arsenicus]|uniref:Uncharacterized protein n=1 Tax=Borborobacter arsenicus TaxID=1851146 RepID=A0A432V9V8_9HYPH|nr:hypothetical protein [Pseudaminobacter arsenicus]RUM98988.1 hypothetical protein EET67_04930 [Pseudaminobacter arsenicus]